MSFLRSFHVASFGRHQHRHRRLRHADGVNDS